ncbi:hypothetical protein GCM10027169_33190 [Gordonia jinhuaensis]|uniref:Septum formation initiator n=1 Tax=Gordonia jinhuaensis TaxID=1517702 RepID=A0A916T3P2_9ACTN|nr:septum formation initiator family protein [Gordonia jinhuaensis]GGB27352.1 hypothetical protein GCM10011489_14390 [Gordonia jinhuaensis]
MSETAAGLANRFEGMNPKRVLILAVVLTIVALTLAVPLRTYFSQQSEYQQLKSSNAQLDREVSDLQQKVDRQNDPAYIEAQARERLQFVKPGDKAFTMQYPPAPTLSPEEAKKQREASRPWYTNLWESVSDPSHG